MTSMNALAVDGSGKTITSKSLRAKRGGRRAPGVVLGLLTAIALLALPAAAGAQTTSTSSLAGYSETPTVSTSVSTHSTVSSSTVSTETASPGVTPASGSKPESESKPEHTSTTPKSEVSPASTESTTTSETTASTLPFTGLNLASVIGGGLLLIGIGVSLLVAQRRRAHR